MEFELSHIQNLVLTMLTKFQIEIKNVDSQTMQNLVNYAYTSQIEIRKDNVQVCVLVFIELYSTSILTGILIVWNIFLL